MNRRQDRPPIDPMSDWPEERRSAELARRVAELESRRLRALEFEDTPGGLSDCREV